MISVPISKIHSAASNRKAGYVEEIMKRGTVSGSDVLLSEDNFEFISKNFALNSSAELIKNDNKKTEEKKFIANLNEKKIETPKTQSSELGKSLDKDYYNLDSK